MNKNLTKIDVPSRWSCQSRCGALTSATDIPSDAIERRADSFVALLRGGCSINTPIFFNIFSIFQYWFFSDFFTLWLVPTTRLSDLLTLSL